MHGRCDKQVQRFRELALPAVTGVKLREIYSYCIVICLVSALPMTAGLMLASAF